MKKFVIFALAVLVAFAMCSCQPTAENLDGDVEFKVYTNAQASKGLNPTDPGQAEVDAIQLAFVPSEQVSEHINCQYKITDTYNAQQSTLTGNEPSNWIDGLITVSHDANGFVTATWATGAQLYLSQGKWTIYARAIDEDTNPLYEGKETVFVNKKNASATITLIPVASNATGTLTIQSLKASKVFDDPTKEQLVYSITGITGGSSVSDKVLSALTTQTGAPTGQYLFDGATETLQQGSYILSVRLQQKTDATTGTTNGWEDYTGGSVVDFGIYKGKETIISGDVEASDYMATEVGVNIENAIFTLEIADDSAEGKVTAGKYTPKYVATITVDSNTPNAKPINIMWYVDGKLERTQALGSASATGEYTDTLESLAVAHGRHNIQAIVTGSITGTTTVDAKSNLVTKVLDTRSKL